MIQNNYFKKIVIFIVSLLSISLAYADGWNNNLAHHETLYADVLTSKDDVDLVTVSDPDGFEVFTNAYFATSGIGNVGIGTTNPGSKLDVTNSGSVGVKVQNTAATSFSRFLVQNDLGSSAYIDLIEYGSAEPGTLFGLPRANRAMLYAGGASSAGLLVGSHPAAPLIFGTSNAERMRIDSSGNVGIGTTGPGEKLDVDDGTIWAHNSGGDENIDLKLGEFDDAPATALFEFSTDDVGEDSLEIKSNRYTSQVRLTRESLGGERSVARFIATNLIGTYLDLYGDDSDNTVKVKINTEGNSYFNGGNVGIGTTAPGALLHMLTNNPDDSGGIRLERTSVTSGRYNQKIDSSGNFIISETAVGDRVTIQKTSGNVGIGTTGPDSLLHVLSASAGPVTAPVSSVITLERGGNTDMTFLSPTTGTQHIFFGDVDDNDIGDIRYNHNENSMRLTTNAGAGFVQIDSSGKVGIGTTIPSSKLDVIGQVRAQSFGGTDVRNVYGQVLTTGTLAPSASSGAINLNGLWRPSGNVGMFICYINRDDSVGGNGEYRVGIHAHGQNYNIYTDIASYNTGSDGFDLTFAGGGASCTFTNNHATATARYVVKSLPLVVFDPTHSQW